MKHVFFSDIHARVDRLVRLLAIAEQLGAEQVYNLGDVVAYTGDPDACFDLIREKRVISVVGNHDREALYEDNRPIKVGSEKRAVRIDYGLTETNLAYVRSLPVVLIQESEGTSFALSHGVPMEFMGDIIFDNVNESNIRGFLSRTGRRINFVGNTHEPSYIRFDGKTMRETMVRQQLRVSLDRRYVYVVAPGCAATPVGSDWPSFVLFDTVAGSVEFCKLL